MSGHVGGSEAGELRESADTGGEELRRRRRRGEPGPPERRRLGERGSGTVLALGLVAVVLVLFGAIALLGRAQSARGAAQAAADLGALAAAQHLLDRPGGGSGAGREACGIARAVASANGASLTECEMLGDGVVRVTAARPGGLGSAQASARAGPAVNARAKQLNRAFVR